RVALACSTASTPTARDKAMFQPAGAGGTVQVSDWKNGRPLFTCTTTPSEPRGLAYSPDGKILAVSCADGWLLLAAEDGRPLHTLDLGTRPRPWIPNVWVANGLIAFSPDGTRLAVWEMANEVQVWGTDGKRQLSLTHAHRVREARFTSDSRSLVTASYD